MGWSRRPRSEIVEGNYPFDKTNTKGHCDGWDYQPSGATVPADPNWPVGVLYMVVRSPLHRVRARPRTFGEARLTLLRERRASLTDIAHSLGIGLSAVSRVNSGQRRSRTIERAIARRLALTEAEAFPEWHGGV